MHPLYLKKKKNDLCNFTKNKTARFLEASLFLFFVWRLFLAVFFPQLAVVVVVGGLAVLLHQPQHNKSPIISRSDEISGMAKHLLYSERPERSVKLQ